METAIARQISRCAREQEIPTVALRRIEPLTEAIARFPSTRYYGSKRRLLGWMYGHLAGLRFETVLDAFGGTGSVSLLFKAMRKQVTYHDGMRFNEDVAQTLLADDLAFARTELESLLASVSPCTATIARRFDGVFFTAAENCWLDGFIEALAEAALSAKYVALSRYLLYQACLKKRPFNLFHRANLGLRTRSGVKRSFGNAVTWERSFADHMVQAYDELARLALPRTRCASILPASDPNLISPGYDLVYVDPPYINREQRYNRDDYWRRYHFLEGLACYQNWEEQIDPASEIGLFPAPDWFGEWGRIGAFKDRLFSFVDAHRRSIVVLSYVSGAHPSEAEIKAHFEDRFSEVSVHSAPHHHALSKSRKRELLFIGRPK
ncbi:Type IIs modification methyltransferase [Magnetospirillum sp. LM-5]|uniref:DNA adenine methylase n=1 Tax=Magnetospirillum sp. LM-5 TaxID=2681466 RepID=UPI0013836847|nr:DNA adenine methylase [Magnetospirillum sp. LM-5]CAA7614358.1 Type IIs modification methyltransferase [Magnetospirillum sp. LM-5]